MLPVRNVADVPAMHTAHNVHIIIFIVHIFSQVKPSLTRELQELHSNNNIF